MLQFDTQTIHRLFNIRITESDSEISESALKQFEKSFGNDVILIIFDEFSMIARKLFHFIECRLEQARYEKTNSIFQNVGIVMCGDPAQILPIADAALWSTKCYKSDGKKKGL